VIRTTRFTFALVALALAACATKPLPTVVVVDKNVQIRMNDDVVTYRSNPVNGRVEEVRRDELYRVFWVKGDDGEWYRVPREDWERAKIGEPLQIRWSEGERFMQPPGGVPCTTSDGRWRC
jgi:hypothetical protein